jgi:hypothetical protein
VRRSGVAVLAPLAVAVTLVGLSFVVLGGAAGTSLAHRTGAAGSTTTVPAGATGTARGTTTTTSDATPAETEVEFFEPWDGSKLVRSVRVVADVSGSCFSGSLPVDDPHAWRCLAGDVIYDPCFAPPTESHPTELACGSPWSGLTMLRLTDPLPGGAANKATAPSAGWLLQLANGARCQLSQGAAGTTDGVPVAYLCSGGTAASALDWSEEPWAVQYLSPAHRSPQRVDVVVAWGG